MAYTHQSFSVGSSLTSSKMNTLDESIDAIRKTEIDSSQPGNVVAGQFWVDNNASTRNLNIYDGTDDITLFEINISTNSATFPDNVYGGDTYDTGAVTSTKIQSGAVGSNQLANNSVGEFAADSISGARFADNSITGGKIPSSTLSSYHVAAGSISGDKIKLSTYDLDGFTNTVKSVVLPKYALFPSLVHHNTASSSGAYLSSAHGYYPGPYYEYSIVHFCVKVYGIAEQIRVVGYSIDTS